MMAGRIILGSAAGAVTAGAAAAIAAFAGLLYPNVPVLRAVAAFVFSTN